MKKIICVTLSLFISNFLFSQSGLLTPKWGQNGDALSSGAWLGSTNSFPLDFKTNNVLRMSIGTTGVVKITNLAGTGNRFLQTDANGNIVPFSMGTASQVLYGNGVWGALPTDGLWNKSGNDLYWNTGNVGIGAMPNSLYRLDVTGAARISNKLYANGGVKTSSIEADSIKMDASKAIYGETTIKGDLKGKSTFDLLGDAYFHAAVKLNNLAGIGNRLTQADA